MLRNEASAHAEIDLQILRYAQDDSFLNLPSV
jgi:hypothetical protein